MKKRQPFKKVCYTIAVEDAKLMETLGREYQLPKSAILRLALKELWKKKAYEKIRESYAKYPDEPDPFLEAAAAQLFKSLDKEEGNQGKVDW